jgi:outer membrane protein insertion porin family
MSKKTCIYISLAICLSLLFLTTGTLSALESNLLKSVMVEGNRLIPDDVILMNIQLKPGDILDEKSIQDEISRVSEIGYFSYVGAEIRTSATGKCLVFKVVEHAIVDKVDILSNSEFSVDKMKELMESKTGTVFNSKLLSLDIQNINDAMARAGYIFTRVVDAFVKESGSQIHIEVKEGKISDIKIEGLKKTKEVVVRRELTSKPGEAYNNFKIIRDLQRIYNLGFFEEVKPEHLPGKAPHEVVLVIQLIEQKTSRVGGGGGYSSLNGLVGFGNVAFNNFRGEGKKINLRTEFGGVNTYELGYFDPWLNGKPHTFGLNLYSTRYSRDIYDDSNSLTEYDEKRIGGRISFGRRVNRDINVSLQLTDENVKLSPTDSSGSVPPSISNGRIQSLGLAVEKDTRDNRYFPTQGVRDTFTMETTGGLLRGENQYTKYTLAFRRFASLSKNKKTVFAFQGVGGTTGIGKGTVPVYELFSVGGGSSVRGYREREFLGSSFFYGNFELRHKLAKSIDLVGFFDVGDAFGIDHNGKNRSFSARKSFGLGIRLKTPMGPVAIDHGKAFDRDDARTSFNFGTSF